GSTAGSPRIRPTAARPPPRCPRTCSSSCAPSATSSEGTMIVNCASYKEGRKVGDIPIESIAEVLAESDQFVWIGLQEPSDELLRQVQQRFALHDLAVEDAHNAHQRPKLEEYGDGLFVVLRTVREADGGLEFGETHLFVGPRYVVTVRHG